MGKESESLGKILSEMAPSFVFPVFSLDLL